MFPLRRLWFVSIIISCAGCELLFPLSPSAPVDVDAAVDAPLPVTCPVDHGGPAYASALTKLLDDTCAQYTEAGDLAVCLDFATGPRDGQPGTTLTPVDLQPAITDGTLFSAVLDPDGNQLITLLSVETAPPPTIEVYLREGTSWLHQSTSPSVGGAVMGVPSRGPNARMLVYDPNAQQVVELEQDGNLAWTTHRTSSVDSIGLRPVNSVMNLSPDGRRVIYKRGDGIAYAFRDSVDDEFANATLLDAPAHLTASWVWMTEDCDRLYGAFLTGGVYVAAQI